MIWSKPTSLVRSNRTVSRVLICLLEQLADGEEYDRRDIERFNQNDEYTLMFIQHGQYGSTFNEERALRLFDGAMKWRKQNQVYGNNGLTKRFSSWLFSEISLNEAAEKFIERHVIFFQNQDRFQHRIRTWERWSMKGDGGFVFLVHFRARAYEKGQENSDEIKRFITYNLEQHLRDYPGQRIVVLFDLTDAGLRQLVSSICSRLMRKKDSPLCRTTICPSLLLLPCKTIIRESWVWNGI